MNGDLSYQSYGDFLRNRGFLAYLITQFCTALNDNIYRLVVSLLLVETTVHGGSISLSGVVFLIPGVLFSGYAGFLADKLSKKWVLIGAKLAEWIFMAMTLIVLQEQTPFWMLAILFAMATQTAFASPAKYGIIPELIPREALSRANGLVEMSTYLAIIIGGSLAGCLLHFFREQLWIIALILITIAGMGLYSSLQIPAVTAKAKRRVFRKNPFAEILMGIGVLKGHRFLTLVLAGISVFWCIAIVFQTNLLVYSENVLQLGHGETSLLMVMTALGIGGGSLLAGKLSADRVEYGLIPLGLLGTAFGMIMLGFWEPGAWGSAILLIWASIFTGLYIVPLKALLQDLPQPRQKGRLIATNNFFADFAMIAGLGILLFLQSSLNFTPSEIFLFWGGVVLGITGIALYLLPAFFIRLMFWLIMHTIYRVKAYNEDYLPKEGPALIVCNHVSFIDALILSAVVPRFIRYIIYQDYYNIRFLKWLFKMAHTIPIKPGDAGVDAALETAREALISGHVVCIFAEGRITRTGNLLPFKRGFERIVQNLDVPIIPVYLDKLWDSIFSYSRGRFFWKLPRRIPIEVSVSFGMPMPSSSKAWDVRQQVQALENLAQARSRSKSDTLPIRLIQAARWRPWQRAVRDFQGEGLNYSSVLSKAIALSKLLTQRYPQVDRIGLYLPPSTEGVIWNIAVLFSGKIAVNLPLSRSAEKINEYVKSAQVKHIFSTAERIANLGDDAPAGLEDISVWHLSTSLRHKIAIRFLLFLPAVGFLKCMRLPIATHEDPAVVVWDVEDHLQPVLLSHRAVIAPVQSFRQVFDEINSQDKVFGLVPFYVTMGLLGSLWYPLLSGMRLFYCGDADRSPQAIGHYIRSTQASVLFDVVENYKSYYAELKPEDFSYIRFAIAYGESLPIQWIKDFQERFGIDLLEGYGRTILGPISINTPNVRTPGNLQRGFKMGSAGQPLPYVSVKIVSKETGEELPHDTWGEIWVRTPFAMLGYLKDWPEKPFPEEEWYNTGVCGLLDQDGFLFLQDVKNF